MRNQFLIVAGIVAIGVLGLAMLLGWLDGKKGPIQARSRLRRGSGNALLGLQEFIEPSVESLFQARNIEQKEEEDDEGLGGDGAAIRFDLAEALSRTPVDPEEVRRSLAAAERAGLDWEVLFEEAVRDELGERPYRAPALPPARRVAPRS